MTHIQQVHDVVARTLWGEARGEGIRGQIAVAWVIRNRVQDAQPRSWWGEGYIGVCRKPWQFSCWNLRDPNYPFVSGARPIPPAQLAQALAVAEQVVAGQVADPTSGATHYHATHLSPPPAWTKGATRTVVLGGHAFFKNVA
ncbi:cell wall hydrolase [Pseudomonas coleopterorum]|uniref:cell wall hydrolase n=1 Tax=Pseudomonas coleopterorum TaxID=1605838 RepID=UPI00106F9DF3|nr:cell wall hydrolase [Pseudomonas coleopterorum]MDY1047193.1 cell wall hydrolase [Pseudomonas coleopterorum]